MKGFRYGTRKKLFPWRQGCIVRFQNFLKNFPCISGLDLKEECFYAKIAKF